MYTPIYSILFTSEKNTSYIYLYICSFVPYVLHYTLYGCNYKS